MRGRVWLAAVAAALAILLSSFAIAKCATEQSRAGTGPTQPVAADTPRSGLPTVRVGELPVAARETLALVDRGGPFPYDKDGTTFNNFERVLPDRAGGYYREYTVPTPGERDRGARRLVVGDDGDVYYTDDHYRSFRQVIRD